MNYLLPLSGMPGADFLFICFFNLSVFKMFSKCWRQNYRLLYDCIQVTLQSMCFVFGILILSLYSNVEIHSGCFTPCFHGMWCISIRPSWLDSIQINASVSTGCSWLVALQKNRQCFYFGRMDGARCNNLSQGFTCGSGIRVQRKNKTSVCEFVWNNITS